jgi:hypothetical protein
MVKEPSASDTFHRCWRLQTCDSCISSDGPCGWCAISQTCVPIVDHGTVLPILAPIRNESICPLGWQERWELRNKTFGCRCSTMTLLSVVIAVASTIVGILLIWSIIQLGKWMVWKWKSRGKEWWRIDRLLVRWLRSFSFRRGGILQPAQPAETENTERRPLLG